MRVTQVIAIAFLTFFSASDAKATAISLGTGKYWLNECTGNSSERSSVEAKSRCELMLFSYLMGAAMQAHEAGQKPIYCDPPPGELSEQLASYLQANRSELESEFLDVIHRFAKQNCRAKKAGT